MPENIREYPSHLVPRVTHLDAQLLDSDIIDILKSVLLDSIHYSGVSIYTKFEPEIDAILKLSLHRFSLIKQKSTVGQSMLQIKYPEITSKKTLFKYSTCVVLVSWLHRRISDIIKYFYGNNAISGHKFISDLELIYSVCHTVNLLVFLHQGFYGTVAERIFKLRPVATAPPHSRQISYSYFSRELLWNGFAELFTVIIPLIPIKQFHEVVKKCLPSHRIVKESPIEGTVSQISTCCVCYKVPVLPHQFGCSHAVCYFCLFDEHLQHQNWQCPLCGHVLESKSQICPVQIRTE